MEDTTVFHGQKLSYVVGFFCVFSELSWEVVVCFV